MIGMNRNSLWSLCYFKKDILRCKISMASARVGSGACQCCLCLIKCGWRWHAVEFLHIRSQCSRATQKNLLESIWKPYFHSLLLAKLFLPHAALKCLVLCLPVHVGRSGKRCLGVGSELVSSHQWQTCLHHVSWAKSLPHCQMSHQTENW